MLFGPAPAVPGMALYLPRAMTEAFFNRVVRLIVATTRAELKAVLENLPHGVRPGVAQQLDRDGEAFRFEASRHCAYYLCRGKPGTQVWSWNYVASEAEFFRLRMLIMSLQGPLDSALADSVYEHATRRSVSSPRPVSMAYNADDFGDSPAFLPVNDAHKIMRSSPAAR